MYGRRRHPCIESLHRPASEIDGIILLAACGFRPPEMNGERGKGRAIRHLDRRLDGQLFGPNRLLRVRIQPILKLLGS